MVKHINTYSGNDQAMKTVEAGEMIFGVTLSILRPENILGLGPSAYWWCGTLLSMIANPIIVIGSHYSISLARYSGLGGELGRVLAHNNLICPLIHLILTTQIWLPQVKTTLLSFSPTILISILDFQKHQTHFIPIKLAVLDLYSFYNEQKSCFINYTNTDCLHFPNWPELKDLNFSVGARIATQRELCPNSVGQVSWRLKENKFNFILSSLQAEF